MTNFKQTCVICGKEFEGFGNNAEPIAHGLCCNDCNDKVVLSRLLIDLYNKDPKEIKNVIKTAQEIGAQQPPQVNDVVLILEMNGEPSYFGKVGIITLIDDAKQIHGTWGGCAIIPEKDTFYILGAKK